MIPCEKIVYVQAESKEAKEAACEVKIMRAATAVLMLDHALSYLHGVFARKCENMMEIHKAAGIIGDKYLECCDEYRLAKREYSEL